MRLRRALAGTLAALALTFTTAGIATADSGPQNTASPRTTIHIDEPSVDDTPQPSGPSSQPFVNVIFPESDGSNSICTNTLTGKKTVISMARAYQCYGWVDLRNGQNKSVGRVYGYHLPAPGSKSGISCKTLNAAMWTVSVFTPLGTGIGWATKGALWTMGLIGIQTCK